MHDRAKDNVLDKAKAEGSAQQGLDKLIMKFRPIDQNSLSLTT